MAKRCFATISDIGEYISYNPESGHFFWKKKCGGRCRLGVPIGSRERRGHLRVCFRQNYIKLHRLAFFLMEGAWPDLEVDHINGIPDDNRWNNLRVVSTRVNRENLHGPLSNNRHGVLGVIWNKQRGKWQASIQVNKKPMHLGFYEIQEDARQAYIEAKRRLHEGCTI